MPKLTTAKKRDAETQSAEENAEEKSNTEVQVPDSKFQNPKAEDPQNISPTQPSTEAFTQEPNLESGDTLNLKGKALFTQAEVNRIVKRELQRLEAKLLAGEQERFNTETGSLRTQLQERDARDLLNQEAMRAGVRNTNLLWQVVRGQIEYDAAGQPANIPVLLESARRDYPEIFINEQRPIGSADGGAGGNIKMPVSVNTFIRHLARR